MTKKGKNKEKKNRLFLTLKNMEKRFKKELKPESVYFCIKRDKYAYRKGP